jgi:FtsP/CotA-like multicopper oxidase with cupredoxin domain
MRARRSQGMQPAIARKLGLMLLSAGLLAVAHEAPAQTPPTVGVACTTSGAPTDTARTFTLTTSTGYVSVPDGTSAFMWGYSAGGGSFQHPGPVLCVNQGDTVTVVLNNTFANDDVSIIFPGQEGVLADGAPAQPQFDGTGTLLSLTQMAPRNGGSVTYSFVASRPGTFLYESGTAPNKQVRMGLFGALVVRPTGAPSQVNARTDSAFAAGEEFMVLLSEIDPLQHEAVRRQRTFNMNNYHPRYWFVNGRGFPDSIADNYASYLPSQPYGALARIHPKAPADLPGAIRYLNVGTENFPFHPHGNNGLVIGRDGNALEGPGGQDLSFEKFAVNIGPGQTWDVIFRWVDAEDYSNPATEFPITLPSLATLESGMFYSGSPFLGTKDPLPPGITTLNECGEYYIISHNHALYQITSWGVNMTGPITYLRIDPPLPNTCPVP